MTSPNSESLSASLAAASALEVPASGKQIMRLAEAIDKEPMSIGDVRLLKLADFLQTLPPEKFSLFGYVQESIGGCGTVCCAIGWLPKLFPESWRWREDGNYPIGSSYNAFDSAMKFFGIDYPTGQQFFSWESYHPNVHPVTVADRLREFVASRNGGGK